MKKKTVKHKMLDASPKKETAAITEKAIVQPETIQKTNAPAGQQKVINVGFIMSPFVVGEARTKAI